MKNGLYHLQHIKVSPIALMCKLSKYFDTYHLAFACVANTNHVSNLRHYRLDHISNSRLQLIKDPIVIKKKLMLYYQWNSLLCLPHGKIT